MIEFSDTECDWCSQGPTKIFENKFFTDINHKLSDAYALAALDLSSVSRFGMTVVECLLVAASRISVVRERTSSTSWTPYAPTEGGRSPTVSACAVPELCYNACQLDLTAQGQDFIALMVKKYGKALKVPSGANVVSRLELYFTSSAGVGKIAFCSKNRVTLTGTPEVADSGVSKAKAALEQLILSCCGAACDTACSGWLVLSACHLPVVDFKR